jgi:tight adherence protein C
MPIPFVSILLLLVFAGAIWVLARAVFPDVERAEIERRVGATSGVEAGDKAVLVDALEPVWSLFLPFTRGIGVVKYRQWIDRSFVRAGMAGKMSGDAFLAYKITMGLLFEVLFILIFAMLILGAAPNVLFHLLAFGVGSFFPDIWLTGQVNERQNEIRRSLPYVMDLLTLSVEAGLDFVAGVHKVCEKAKAGPLVDELAFMLREIQVGSTRQQALRSLATRTDMPELRSFSALLIQADILGASIGPVLRAQSDLVRTQRFQAAEKQGAQAATKILFPLILFIMPAVFIVIFGPIVLNFLFGSGVFGGGAVSTGGIGG